jgi:hypothetical protein
VKLQRPGFETRAEDRSLARDALELEERIKESHRREQLIGVVQVAMAEATRFLLGRPQTETLAEEAQKLIRNRVHTFEEFADVPSNERVAQEIEVEMSVRDRGDVHLDVKVPQTVKYLVLPVEIGDVVKIR